ncbi:hypothetical protein N0V93_000667 [Gnomoniopsis smithogilvyi]|uniref:Uncharacterized protein n=1 Tax=Gnomoniopsis smithogilvyi TaxID=1191159 RepID=A0A9W8Z284_9PEZI|nr:hypothetical protein N0V93_000667 [Gnomoniopsis smithogilvyi]
MPDRIPPSDSVTSARRDCLIITVSAICSANGSRRVRTLLTPRMQPQGRPVQGPLIRDLAIHCFIARACRHMQDTFAVACGTQPNTGS